MNEQAPTPTITARDLLPIHNFDVPRVIHHWRDRDAY